MTTKSKAVEGEVVSKPKVNSTSPQNVASIYPTASLVLGILSLCGACTSVIPFLGCFTFPATVLMSVAGLILGFLGKDDEQNKSYAQIGIVLNALVIVGLVSLFFLGFAAGFLDAIR